MKGKAIYVLFYVTFFLFTSNAFDLVLDPIASFHYGDRMIRIWPCASNGPELQASLWGFRYDPVILPAVDENNRVILTTTKDGSRWRTDLVLAMDDPTVRELAFWRVQELYKKVEGLQLENVFVLPVKMIIIDFLGLFEYFRDVNLTSTTKPCPERASCFTAPPSKFRIIFHSPSQNRALELEDALRSAQLNYEIQSYASIRKNDSSKIGNPLVTLDSVQGHLDLLSITTGLRPLYPQTKQLAKRSTEEENFVKKFDKKLSSIEASFAKNLNVSLQFEVLTKNISEELEKRIENVEANFVRQVRFIEFFIKDLSQKLSTIETSLANFTEELLKQTMNVEANLIDRLGAQDPELWNRVSDIQSKLAGIEAGSKKSNRLMKDLITHINRTKSDNPVPQTNLTLLIEFLHKNFTEELEKRTAHLEANFVGHLGVIDSFTKNLDLKFSTTEASIAKSFAFLKDAQSKLEFHGKNYTEELMKQTTNVEANLMGRLGTMESELWNRVREIGSNLSGIQAASNRNTGLINDLINRTLCEFSGWKIFCINGQCHCYKYIEKQMTWTDADENCKRLSSELVSVHSVQENDFLYELILKQQAWIGFNDRQIEGTYRWSDGSDVTYTAWTADRGQPTGGTWKNCVYFSRFYGGWYDHNCGAKESSLCKKWI